MQIILGCQLVSSPAHREPIKSTPSTHSPWQDLALDLLGPLLSGDYVLVVVNYFIRYYEIEIMRSTTSAEIIKSLERIFMIHGLPLSVTSDVGRLKDIWKAVVSNTGKPYHYGPKKMAQ